MPTPDISGAPNRSPSASETSPLLPRIDENGLQKIPSHPLDPSAALAPDGADPYEDSEEELAGEHAETEDGRDVERVTSNASIRHYEGIPEVKARMHIILPALAIGVFLAAADQTIIVSTYGKIGTDLNALNNTSWIATAYFLTLTSFQPLYGKLSDIFTRKSCLLFAYTIFGIGCLFCGIASNMKELIAARAFSGIGGGGMTTMVSILLSDAVPLRERGTWQGYTNIIYAAGAATGAPIGGLLADAIGWRWGFIAQAPLCLLAFIVVSIVLHLPKRDSTHWREKLRRIDFLGALVLICAVFTLLVALDRGSNIAWKDKYTLSSLAASLIFFALFLLVETKVAPEPFAPFRLIFARGFFACYLCNFFSFAGWLAAIFYIPLYFQGRFNYSATHTGVLLIPSTICGVSGSLFGGFYMQRTGKFYWITVCCYTSLVVGLCVILSSTWVGPKVGSTAVMVLGMCICGFSNGIGVTTSLIALIANASHEDQAVVTACSYLFRSLGSVLGISLSATAANQSLRKYLEEELGSGHDAALVADKVRQSLDYLQKLKPAVRDLVRQSYAKSTRVAFAVEVGLVAGAALAAWGVSEKRLGR